MFDFIFFSLFSAVFEAMDCKIQKIVIIEEKQEAVGPQLFLDLKEESTSGIPNRKKLVPFEIIDALSQIFLYPNLGYGELFQLFNLEKDVFASYKFQRLMIQILVHRANEGCIESNEELCRYLLSHYNTCCLFQPTFIKSLREYRKILKTHQISVQGSSEQKSFPVVRPGNTEVEKSTLANYLHDGLSLRQPHNISKTGRIFLQSKSGVRDHQLSDTELMQECEKLPIPLQYAVIAESKGGGRRGFDSCLEGICGVSLCSETIDVKQSSSPGRSPKLIPGEKPVIAAAPRDRASHKEAGSWFSASARAVGYWITKNFSNPNNEEKKPLRYEE
jgi:hypothetical protein